MFVIKSVDHRNKTFTIEPQDANFETDRPIELISYDDFQRLFYVAYAITVHKSQGESYDIPYTIHEWERYDARMKYLSLSRATSVDLINIV